MNKDLKKILTLGFQTPPPAKKLNFLEDIQWTPAISHFQFICTQVAYIRKWVWVISALIFTAALFITKYSNINTLWEISAWMPLLALSLVTESGRSEIHGMTELELSTRFSLKSVLLARLGILGLANLCLVCLLIPLTIQDNGITILQTGIYILCPYLLTTFWGLYIVRKLHGKESVYLCAAITAIISFATIFSSQTTPVLYEEKNFIWWLAVSILLGIGTIRQCYQMIKQTEEFAWNL